MARTTRSKKTSAASNTRSSSNTRSQPESLAKPPRRREVMAVICFIVGIFSFIGYFDTEPVFIAFLTGFVKRLIGFGYYALPPALIMCSVILAFHKGRPILMRTICTVSLTIITGALIHLFLVDGAEYEFSFAMIGRLC